MKDSLVLYIHGKGGSIDEAAHYRPLFPDCDVIGLDYRAETPWDAAEEFPSAFDRLRAGYRSVTLIGNSIGAYFSLLTLADKPIERAFFISPVVDMERLITDMMTWANVTEDELRTRGEIPTSFGETLSWRYLCYVREHPIRWRIPTSILCANGDTLVARESLEAFSLRTGASLTVMENGEHWFHTREQMSFLDTWITQKTKGCNS